MATIFPTYAHKGTAEFAAHRTALAAAVELDQALRGKVDQQIVDSHFVKLIIYGQRPSALAPAA
jgi:hypothetical protein